jgi:hypothetical protein
MLNIIYLDLLQTSEWLIPFLNKLNVNRQGEPNQDEELSDYL